MKRAARGALLLLTVFLAAGCLKPPGATTHIQFSFWGSVQQEKQEEEIVRAFEKTHPAIKVDLLPIGAHFVEKIQAMIVGDICPDVFMTDMSHYDEWASRGTLLDLTDDAKWLQAQAEVMPVPLHAFEREGRFYGIPVNCGGYVMYCNLDALKKAGMEFPKDGVTWDFLARNARRFSRRAGNPTALTDYALVMPDYPLIVFWAFGAQLFDDPFHPTRITINTEAARKALDFLRAMRANPAVVPPSVASDQGSYQLFRDGKAAFYFSGRWITPDLANKTAFQWDVAPMPSGPGGRLTLHGGTALLVSKSSPHQAEAREFVRFYASTEGARLAMRGGRAVPIFRSLAYGPEFLSLRPPESMFRFAETMEDHAASYVGYVPGTDEVTRIFNDRVDQALSFPQYSSAEIVQGMEDDLKLWLEKGQRRGTL